MYKLYRQQNGQVQQVPVNTPEEDITPPNIEEAFPNPLQAKGEPNNLAPFVLQEQKQFDLIKENEGQQAKFQTSKLQNNNYQILNMEIQLTDSTAVQDYYYNDYNTTKNIGDALNAGVLFGSNTADVTKSKYYNIVYVNARCYVDASGVTSNFVISPSFMEFYASQKLTTGIGGGKIPRQIEANANSNETFSIGITGNQNGVQSFGVDVYNENAYYTQSADLKGIRSNGIYLKKVNLNFGGSINLSTVKLNVEVAYDQNTEGNNY